MTSPALKIVEPLDTTDIEIKAVSITDQAHALVIRNDDEFRKGSEVLLIIKDALKELESTFGPIKKKAHETWKEIVAQEKRHEEPLLAAERVIKQKIGAYTVEQERKRREEEARLLIEAKKREEETLLSLAIEAEKQGQKQEAEAILETPTFVPPPIVPATPKITGVSTRIAWKFRITDPNAVPRQYLVPDEKAIAGVVRSLGERTNIPGVQVYPEQVVSAGRR